MAEQGHASVARMSASLAIIGGSGLYELDGLTQVEQVHVETPFGAPSDAIVRGVMNGVQMFFVPRHGRGHRLAPHRINHRANLFALKQLGAQQVLSVSAVGSLKAHLAPGDVVVVDQYIDRTHGRPSTFFDDYGIVAHVAFSDPTDAALSNALYEAAREVGLKAQLGGTYVCMEGPQFSTRAESMLHRSWGADVIGMTNMPEAKLAREAELPYASLAMVTDYDCWHESEGPVDVETVLKVLHANVEHARKTVAALTTRLPDPAHSPASHALRDAILTPPEHVPPEARQALGPLLAKYAPQR